MKLCVLVSLAAGAFGHGQLTIPAGRNGGTTTSAGGCPDLTFSNGHDICSWMTNGINIKGSPTLPDNFITTGSDAKFCVTNPWRSPGSIPLEQPCGHVGGKDGRDLPMTKVTTVEAGGDLEVAWAINANHGGGYSYRLCPTSTKATEECFQKNILRASSKNRDHAWVQMGDDAGSRRQIPMMRTTTGTFPTDSEWTRNPIPARSDYFPPPLNDQSLGGHGPFPWNIVESYAIPANLTTGAYLLSWRWDCEGSPQIWLNCADIHVNGKGPGKPTPAPPPSKPTPPPPTPPPTPKPKPQECQTQTASSKDCGWYGINEQQCESQGCCWKQYDPNPHNFPWCFYH